MKNHEKTQDETIDDIPKFWKNIKKKTPVKIQTGMKIIYECFNIYTKSLLEYHKHLN